MFRKLKALSVLGVYLAGATFVAAQQADLNSPDLVLINGKILTMDAGSSIAEAIAVRDGKILAVGSSASIKAFAAKKKPGEWIVGGPWHPPSQLAEKRYLTRQEIDSAAPNNPVYLRTVGHFSMANSLALQSAGVDKSSANPSGDRKSVV